MGELVTVGDVSWYVKSSGVVEQDVPMPGGTHLKPSGKHVWAGFSVYNAGRRPIVVIAPGLLDGEGRGFLPLSVKTYLVPPQLFRSVLNPGIELDATVLFDVPGNAGGLRLVVRGGEGSADEEAYVDLGL